MKPAEFKSVRTDECYRAYLEAIERMHTWCAGRDTNFRQQMVTAINRHMEFTPPVVQTKILKEKGRYIRTPEQRARMAEAARRRWAKRRAAEKPA